MGKDGCIRIAGKAGQPVTSPLTVGYGNSMAYEYGGSDVRFHNLGGNADAFVRSDQGGQRSREEELDLRRSDLDNSGLITFKERWPAARKTLTTWRAPALIAAVSFQHLNPRLAKEVCTWLPDTVLILAGRLLYFQIN